MTINTSCFHKISIYRYCVIITETASSLYFEFYGLSFMCRTYTEQQKVCPAYIFLSYLKLIYQKIYF